MILRLTARALLIATLLLPLIATASQADGFTVGRAAYNRGDFVRAARVLIPLAERGNAGAQTMLGFMYANGRGVPQSYEAASYWYRCAALQGDVRGQYLLGLMYDKGHGVPLDVVSAYMWLNLAAAGASKRERDYYERLRNAVAFKMTRAQLWEGQTRALEWSAFRPY